MQWLRNVNLGARLRPNPTGSRVPQSTRCPKGPKIFLVFLCWDWDPEGLGGPAGSVCLVGSWGSRRVSRE